MPDVTGEQQISDSAWGGQQFLLAASRPIRIEYGIHLWDNGSGSQPDNLLVGQSFSQASNLVPRAMPVRGLGLPLALGKRNRSA